jgi:hypothetical protein
MRDHSNCTGRLQAPAHHHEGEFTLNGVYKMTRNPKVRQSAIPPGRFGSVTPAEEAFLRQAEQIAREVAAMTDEEVADYIVDNDLQELVAPERIDIVLREAAEEAARHARAAANDSRSDNARNTP